ncbi:MAG: DUF2339 domain-containing protein [Nitratireductor sp.]
MEALLVMLGLAFLASPVVAIIMAWTQKTRLSEQGQELRSLKGEIAALRDAVHELQSGTGDTGPEPKRKKSGISAEASAPAGKTSEPLPHDGQKNAEETRPSKPTAVPPVSAAPATDAAKTPPRPRRTLADIETLVGAKWSVLLGGLAVALGAIFLVRYTIEAGLLGPAARITLAALFSAALFAGGEWLRRKDREFSIPAIPNADIPGILTGAGAVAAFATIYAAYALYGFIGPAAAFVLLTLAGLVSLVLSAIHGPKLAALGVVGSYATPLLVSTDAPNALALAIHVLVVTGSIFAMARIRGWLWLAFCGVAGGSGWTVLASTIGGTYGGIAGFLLSAGLAALFTLVFAWDKLDRPSPAGPRSRDLPGLIAFTALAAAVIFQIGVNAQLPLIATALCVSLVVAVASAVWPALSLVALAAVAVSLFAIAALKLNLNFQGGINRWEDIRAGLVPPDILAYVREAALIATPPALALLYGSWRYGVLARRSAGQLASAAGALVFFAMVLGYLRTAPFETSLGFGAASLVLAFTFAGLVESFSRLDRDDLVAPAPAAFAVTSVSLLSLALAVSLNAGLMPVAFSFTALGIAWIYTQRPLPVMPWLAIAAAVLAGIALYANVPFPGELIGKLPFFNKLLLLAGLPSAALIAAGEIIRRHGREFEASIVTAIGLAGLALFTSLEIRHWLNDGIITADGMSLDEVATQSLAALAFSAGLQRAAQRTSAKIYSYASLAAGAISCGWIALGLLVLKNPFFDGGSVGARPVFNLLLPAYLMTSLACAAVALYARPVRPRWFTLSFAALAGLLLFTFVSLSVRHAFKGDALAFWRSTSDAEFWTYSAAWLLMGAGVLALGGFFRSRPVRFASALLIGLTVLKVFLLDLSELEGVLRALSFIGLGLSLLVIGRFYQRFLARNAAEEEGVGKT